MSFFKENRVIRSEYVNGSGGYRRMFVRLSGTRVERRQAECGYVEGEDAIVIQWDGSPGYDSGYHARYFPATMAGLKAAHALMNELG